VYEHGATLGAVLDSLAGYALPCLLIDDGSSEPTRRELERLARLHRFVRVHRRARNGGKGAALCDGYALAAGAGFTHVVQLDADGQHDAGDVPRFLEAMRKAPDALVLGVPIFDQSAPRSRRIARQASRLWVWIGTLSTQIRDPLCGMRGVPLAPVLRVLSRHRLGLRMEFEPELAARCLWEGVPIVSLPTRVIYPPGGLSHFRVGPDFARLSLAYARLLFGMLWRAPRLLARRRSA
jgi:glycosyltransferase involved in cell wall biosynthesis